MVYFCKNVFLVFGLFDCWDLGGWGGSCLFCISGNDRSWFVELNRF